MIMMLGLGDLMKLLIRVREGRRKGGNRGMGNHIERNLSSFLIAAALFTSVVDGQYGTIEIPPAQRYPQAVFSPPAPQAFSIQLRRELLEPSPAPSSSSPVEYTPPPSPVEYTPPPSPVEYTPSPSPVEYTPSPSPVEYTPPPSPVEYTPSPSPVEYTPPPSPVEYTPSPSPVEYTPPPSPVEYTPPPSPVEYTPSPSPVEYTPPPSPVEYTPSPSPVEYTPPPSPVEYPPPPSPVQDTPAPTPAEDAPPPPPSSPPLVEAAPPPLPSSPPPVEYQPPYSDSSTASKGEKSNQVPVIVGSVIAGIVVLALIGAAIWWKSKKKPAEGDEEKPGACDDIESTQRSPKEGHAIFPVKGTAVAYSMEAQEAPAEAANGTAVAMTARHFTYNEILKITGEFGRVIGEGGSATVYYGRLQEGGGSMAVAVKKIKDSSSPFGDFLAEVKIMTKIHHRNLVSLVGLCEERDEIILVSEYMAGGSLFDKLKARRSELTWRKRLQIALEAATGLEYLHTGCKPAVIHRDIKSTNILLDENLEAKLAGFGLSKAGAVDGSEYSAYQTKVAGTMGYIDPEYIYTQTLTKKSDVYSFGVVLFELITGKPAIVITESNEKCHLTKWVMPMLMGGEIESLLDPLLKGHCNIDSVWEVAGVAKTATQHPSGRPDMSEIVSTLKAALRMETSWSTSETITSQSSFREVPLNPVAR